MCNSPKLTNEEDKLELRLMDEFMVIEDDIPVYPQAPGPANG